MFLGPIFHFLAHLFSSPRHSLPSKPLSDMCPPYMSSQNRIGPCFPLFYIIILLSTSLERYYQPIVHHNRELYCSLFLALDHCLPHLGSPIILLFIILGVGTSHLYINLSYLKSWALSLTWFSTHCLVQCQTP